MNNPKHIEIKTGKTYYQCKVKGSTSSGEFHPILASFTVKNVNDGLAKIEFDSGDIKQFPVEVLEEWQGWYYDKKYAIAQTLMWQQGLAEKWSKEINEASSNLEACLKCQKELSKLLNTVSRKSNKESSGQNDPEDEGQPESNESSRFKGYNYTPQQFKKKMSV